MEKTCENLLMVSSADFKLERSQAIRTRQQFGQAGFHERVTSMQGESSCAAKKLTPRVSELPRVTVMLNGKLPLAESQAGERRNQLRRATTRISTRRWRRCFKHA